MSDTTIGIIFIAGKAAIWLLIPLAIGIWELRRHKKMMAAEKAPERGVPAWLAQRAPARRPAQRPPNPTEREAA
ncbi:MAG: hypothetical protein AAF318_02420 [Pseudomonadota bacterium]